MLKYFLSPTFALAKLIKGGSNGNKRASIITKLNYAYLGLAIISVIGIAIFQNTSAQTSLKSTFQEMARIEFLLKYIWGYFLFSRCNEIFIAFLEDATEKLTTKDSNSSLSYQKRLKLAFKSYIELIINFAIIYMLIGQDHWHSTVRTSNIEAIQHSLFYSAATITTLADSTLSPQTWLSKGLSIYQIFCGFTLLIVCFTVYTSKAINGIGNNQEQQN